MSHSAPPSKPTKPFIAMHKTTRVPEWFEEDSKLRPQETLAVPYFSQERAELLVPYMRRALLLAVSKNGYNYFFPDQAEYQPMVYGLQRYARLTASGCELCQPDSKNVPFERDATYDGPLLLNGPYQQVHHQEFIEAVFCAMIVRDEPTLARLAKVDLQHVRASGVTMTEAISALAYALQAWIGKAPYALAQTRSALKSAEAAASTNSHTALITHVRGQLLLQLQSPELSPDVLNEALVSALEAHKQYYTLGENASGGGGESDDSRSFLCLQALAFACVLHDRNIPLQVESDYLPQPLIKRSI